MNMSLVRHKLVAMLLFTSVLLCTIGFPAIEIQAVSNTIEKVYCSATLEDEFTDNEILIVITPDNNFREYSTADFSEINCTALKELACSIGEGELCRIIKLTVGIHSKENILNAIDYLEQRDDIYSAEPNYLLIIESESSVAASEYNEQWAVEKISLPSAWNITTGSSLLRVGIIDSGIYSSHPDLKNRVSESLSHCFDPDYYTALDDSTGHGTSVAGVIGALWNDSGIRGVCQNVELVSLRVSPSGSTTVERLVEAVEYADSAGINILNCSLGVYNYPGDITSLETSIRDYSGLFVCSAGNNGLDNDDDNNVHIPSNFDLHNLIAVAASTEADQRYVSSDGGSSYGKTTVDLFAPGDGVLTCFPSDLCVFDTSETKHFSGGYHYKSGTSFAAPYVAGVAALLLSKYRDMRPCEIKDTILSNVDDCGTAFDGECVSNGRLNAYKALSNPIRHTATYGTSTGSDGHRATCSCGYTFVASHEYTITKYNTQKHKLTCSVCGYVSYETHVWNVGGNLCLSCGFNTEGSLMPRSINTNYSEQHCLQ